MSAAESHSGRLLEFGDIYWLDDCPPLDGTQDKRRPVVIITPSVRLQSGTDPIIVVAATTSPVNDADRVELPNLQTDPTASTGLPAPCRAVPRWLVKVRRAHLIERCGKLSKVLLQDLWQAVQRRLDSPDAKNLIRRHYSTDPPAR